MKKYIYIILIIALFSSCNLTHRQSSKFTYTEKTEIMKLYNSYEYVLISSAISDMHLVINSGLNSNYVILSKQKQILYKVETLRVQLLDNPQEVSNYLQKVILLRRKFYELLEMDLKAQKK